MGSPRPSPRPGRLRGGAPSLAQEPPMVRDIPEVPQELRDAVRSLARSGWLFRGVLVAAAEGRPLDELLEEHGESLALAERVLDTWAEHLGIEGSRRKQRPRRGGSPRSPPATPPPQPPSPKRRGGREAAPLR